MKSQTLSPERLTLYIRVTAFLLVLVSAIALFLTEKLNISSLILLGALPVAWVFGSKKQPSGLWEIGSFLYLLFFFFDMFRISQSLAPSLVHLFIFIIINKIFNLQSERDYYQLYLLTFLSMLAASSLSVEIQMLYLIVLYIFLLVWNVISMTLWREWRKGTVQSTFPFSLFHPKYVLLTALITSFVFVVALGIFFVVPRMQLGYLAGLSLNKVQHVSGFSQKVQLGDIAEIQTNTAETMRVKVTMKESIKRPRFYWRGIAFDHYDGKNWSASFPGTHFLFQDSSNTFYNTYYTDDPELLIKQEFYLAPINTRVVFGQERVVKVIGNFSAITRDSNGTLTGMGKPENYIVYSRMIHSNPEKLKNKETRIPDQVLKYYTQLPERSPEIETLARTITSGSRTELDRVRSIQKYLEENYAYTTTSLPRDEKDPVSAFLFKVKAGHCEYFATSMVLLLRHLGIPARVVNGFMEGEYNEIGDFYLVRQSDAHSWVEVYFGEQLWVPFDPSPRNVLSSGFQSWLRWFDVRQILDSISFFWDRYILIFSAQDQLDALTVVREGYQTVAGNVKRNTEVLSTSLIPEFRLFLQRNKYSISALIICICGAILFFNWYRKKKRRTMMISTPVLFYQEMLSILERKGWIRPESATPAEFENHVKGNVPSSYAADISILTQLFYEARYGNHVLTKEEKLNVEGALHRLDQLRWD